MFFQYHKNGTQHFNHSDISSYLSILLLMRCDDEFGFSVVIADKFGVSLDLLRAVMTDDGGEAFQPLGGYGVVDLEGLDR